MKPWDIYHWQFPHGTHPAVIISPLARCENPAIETVNVVGCSSKKAQRSAEVHELILDQEDGLDWSTLCRCDVLYLARKTELLRKLGSVTRERRRQIGKKIIALVELYQS